MNEFDSDLKLKEIAKLKRKITSLYGIGESRDLDY